MTDNTDWLLKPENYRTLQKIRKRIRSIYGTDIRITSATDVARLLDYRNDKDATLARMLETLAERVELPPDSSESHLAGRSGTTVRMYRGRVVA